MIASPFNSPVSLSLYILILGFPVFLSVLIIPIDPNLSAKSSSEILDVKPLI
jgi:hypothetical protein